MAADTVRALPPHIERTIDKPELADLLGVSLRTLDRMVRANRFPPPIRMNRRRVVWTQATVRAWLDAHSQPVAIVEGN